MDITFVWEINEEDLLRMWSPSWPANGDDYCGSLFFGDLKLEFIWDDTIRNRVNCFQYGTGIYGFINGIPYDECDRIQNVFSVPSASNLGSFIWQVEKQVITILKANKNLLPAACKATDPAVWYADRDYVVSPTHTHTVSFDQD